MLAMHDPSTSCICEFDNAPRPQQYGKLLCVAGLAASWRLGVETHGVEVLVFTQRPASKVAKRSTFCLSYGIPQPLRTCCTVDHLKVATLPAVEGRQCSAVQCSAEQYSSV